MKKNKVYLSGPITSLPLEDASSIFLRSEKHLRGYGYSVVNPMNNGLLPDSSWEEHMRKDIVLLLDCDHICLLPNYRQSKGAMLELSIATALQMTVINHSDDEPSGISLAEKHLNDIIEEPSRTQRQVMLDNLSEINKAVREIGKENLEGIRILANTLKDTPASNVITNRPFIHPNLLGERTEPTPYAKIQRRADFLHNFKDGWALFNSNALFRTITMLVMNGASEYDLMLELIFMIDGKGKPNFPLFKSHNPTHNETE